MDVHRHPAGGRAALTAATAALVAAVVVAGACLAGPLTGRYQLLAVRSGSMAPALPVGSIVVVRPIDPSTVRVGDVLSLERAGAEPVSHRVVEIVEPGEQPVVRTKGDANAAADPGAVRLTGTTAWRVRAVVPWAGTALGAMAGLRGLGVAGITLALAVLVGGLRAVWAVVEVGRRRLVLHRRPPSRLVLVLSRRARSARRLRLVAR